MIDYLKYNETKTKLIRCDGPESDYTMAMMQRDDYEGLVAEGEKARKLKELNDNLLRIMRERANQARGIQDKKVHNGFIVLESRQWMMKYERVLWFDESVERLYYRGIKTLEQAVKDGYAAIRQSWRTTWRSYIQTPFEASLLFKDIEEDLMAALMSSLETMGCLDRQNDDSNGEYIEFVDEDEKPINGMFRWNFKANYRTGLWEAEVYTTEELVVPEENRPPKKRTPKEDSSPNSGKPKEGKRRKKKQTEEVEFVEVLPQDDDWDLFLEETSV